MEYMFPFGEIRVKYSIIAMEQNFRKAFKGIEDPQPFSRHVIIILTPWLMELGGSMLHPLF